MIEQIFQMARNDNHTIEKVIAGENADWRKSPGSGKAN
jgi:hypothetical protein